ncbi:hypothetical protein DSO57_1025442 [Entomophthora muscae]|uniref:Uncharacterized protein n=1 Tax=Entomophthora muscae TaxID=34485 RepID=A0ACC2SRQ1_9FUNG|nr:hypothetical protein DSO57_1025442 [Entomophthora muscae]
MNQGIYLLTPWYADTTEFLLICKKGHWDIIHTQESDDKTLDNSTRRKPSPSSCIKPSSLAKGNVIITRVTTQDQSCYALIPEHP